MVEEVSLKRVCCCVICKKVGDEHPNHSERKCLFICWECEEKKVDIKCSKCQKVDHEARFENAKHKLLYLAGHIFYVCAECEMKK